MCLINCGLWGFKFSQYTFHVILYLLEHMHSLVLYLSFPTMGTLLARFLLPQSISQYLNYVGLLHREMGFQNPLTDNWVLSSVLTGIRRILGTPPMPRLPMTVNILRRIRSRLNRNSSRHASFWAICLTAFFGLFRKSHLLPVSVSAFDPKRQFLRSDFVFKDCVVYIHVRWSKTIQLG